MTGREGAAAAARARVHQKRSGGGGSGSGPRSHPSEDGSAGAPRGEGGTGAAARHEAGGMAAARWLLLPGGCGGGSEGVGMVRSPWRVRDHRDVFRDYLSEARAASFFFSAMIARWKGLRTR